jgi:hypothetical protein
MCSSPELDSDSQNATEPSDTFHDAGKLTIPVNPARLAWGRYNHGRGRDTGEGDIHASYSADRIGSGQPVRKPFQHDGSLWVCTGIWPSGLTASGSSEHEAYRIIPARVFEGTPTTYGATISTGEAADAARRSPNGFYHGMEVKFACEAYLLCGPPLRFIPMNVPSPPDSDPGPPEPVQLGLF